MKNVCIVCSVLCFALSWSQNKRTTENYTEPTKPEATEVWTPKPKTVTPGKNNAAPSDAIILFDGSNFDEWVSARDSSEVKWILNKDRSMTVKLGIGIGDIQTKRNFGDVQLHIEWKSPEKIVGDGQNRGNSGVFLQKLYELQVLDNNNNETYVNGQVGSIYKQSVPLAKASVPTGEWNAYDIIYHAPVFGQYGDVLKKATMTVLHNGVLIQDHFELIGPIAFIGWPRYKPHGKLPILLQNHNCEVSYRNIWIREL
ncbi:3-keto-disaccharide hydrolase [Confluentibacter sediminis]|uniref:3-keto-disaccharide hydrolase n=1 Tax=Confluentibacter sediminis TaxID=2219045 RepID=UPI000DAE6AAE|nr:DUF1080 domain-containing protein [Confluentibacter sediminis]